MGDPLQGKDVMGTPAGRIGVPVLCRERKRRQPRGWPSGPFRPESEMKRSAPLSREWSWGGWSQGPVRGDGAAGGNEA